MALSIVCRPTRKAARISVRTEREALEYAAMPASARLISSTTHTRPIRRNRSDTWASAERWLQRLKDAPPDPNSIPVRAARFCSRALAPGRADGGEHSRFSLAAWHQRLPDKQR